MTEFKDNGKTLDDFYNYTIVACPNCKKPIDFFDLKITCTHCGYHKAFQPSNSWYNRLTPINVEMEDFLVTDCCGKTFWALNTEHLSFIEEYVNADIRKRTPNINKSLVSRLPQWIKSKKNKPEVLKAVARLRNTLTESGYESRFQKTE